MEYQRVYYEALPKEIAAASKTIMDGIAAAAEKETAAAQARLTDSVVREAQNLASKIQYDRLVSMGLLALICLLAYGSLMLWAGFRIDTGQEYSSGGNSAHALRLAHQRAVSRGRVILRRFERKELRRRKKGDMETRNLGTITYFYRMQHVCLFNNILK